MEVAGFTYFALKALGFKVDRIVANALMNRPMENRPPTHLLLVVTVENRTFLVDPSFGYNMLRYPLEVNFKETQEVSLTHYEKYQLECHSDYYQLNMWVKDSWFSLHRFDRPLHPMSDEEVNDCHKFLLETPMRIFIRDLYLTFGRITENGRVGFHYEPHNPEFTAFKMLVEEDKTTKTFYKDYETLQAEIKEMAGIELPPFDRLKASDKTKLENAKTLAS